MQWYHIDEVRGMHDLFDGAVSGGAAHGDATATATATAA
jgi:hypothetical protein